MDSESAMVNSDSAMSASANAARRGEATSAMDRATVLIDCANENRLHSAVEYDGNRYCTNSVCSAYGMAWPCRVVRIVGALTELMNRDNPDISEARGYD